MPENFRDAHDGGFEITAISAEGKAESLGSELLAFSGVEIHAMRRTGNIPHEALEQRFDHVGRFIWIELFAGNVSTNKAD